MAILPTKNMADPANVDPFAGLQAATAADRAQPGKNAYIAIANGSGVSTTVTADSVAPCSQGFDHNISVTVPAAGKQLLGPLPPERFASSTDGLVAITTAPTTTITLGVVFL